MKKGSSGTFSAKQKKKTLDKEEPEKRWLYILRPVDCRSQQGSDRERLGMEGMIIYTLQRDARTMLTGTDFAVPFIQHGPIYCKISEKYILQTFKHKHFGKRC